MIEILGLQDVNLWLVSNGMVSQPFLNFIICWSFVVGELFGGRGGGLVVVPMPN